MAHRTAGGVGAGPLELNSPHSLFSGTFTMMSCVAKYFRVSLLMSVSACGLEYLACKKTAESLGMWRNPASIQGWHSGTARISSLVGEEWSSNSYVPGVAPDAERAFTAIRMRDQNSGRRNSTST
eukprot:jgi/Botrbrau1/2337/Bobra.39_1s0026.1